MMDLLYPSEQEIGVIEIRLKSVGIVAIDLEAEINNGYSFSAPGDTAIIRWRAERAGFMCFVRGLIAPNVHEYSVVDVSLASADAPDAVRWAGDDAPLVSQYADALRKLEAENARLRAALSAIADNSPYKKLWYEYSKAQGLEPLVMTEDQINSGYSAWELAYQQIAQRALAAQRTADGREGE